MEGGSLLRLEWKEEEEEEEGGGREKEVSKNGFSSGLKFINLLLAVVSIQVYLPSTLFITHDIYVIQFYTNHLVR